MMKQEHTHIPLMMNFISAPIGQPAYKPSKYKATVASASSNMKVNEEKGARKSRKRNEVKAINDPTRKEV